jgi:hypothetical protein
VGALREHACAGMRRQLEALRARSLASVAGGSVVGVCVCAFVARMSVCALGCLPSDLGQRVLRREALHVGAEDRLDVSHERLRLHREPRPDGGAY